MKKSTIVGILAVILLIAGIIFATSTSSNAETDLSKFDVDAMKIYKSATCGCCTLYTQYMEKKSNIGVEAQTVQDISSVKKEFGVPMEMESCHTTMIGGYFVEGHVPLEAIAKLLAEKPDIAGIAMPGMPMGSPGMPGSKQGPFTVHAVNKDGTFKEFMRL